MAQRPNRPEGGPPRGGGEFGRDGHPDGFRPPPNPLLSALDQDGDRELSAEEIANAVAALKSLDSDSDGTLSRGELRPKRVDGRRPDGPAGEFGRRGPRGRGGPSAEGGRRRGPNAEGGGPGGDFDPNRFVERIMKFDEDEDGQISSDELPDRMRRMIEKGDGDEDGALSKDELLAMAQKAGGNLRGRGAGGGRRLQDGERPARPQRPALE